MVLFIENIIFETAHFFLYNWYSDFSTSISKMSIMTDGEKVINSIASSEFRSDEKQGNSASINL